ncbi:Nuclear RNA export factor 1 [Holothuria leucospilota]|uniref:Nuclear RNA export factor 1 n=1 Tax=Holothuria leucospilota TaxID=206669 RepID=A0A9Q1HH82_HOLLE|nr:Nuclear RNA export factor 1 [Holothuria leucospilota]
MSKSYPRGSIRVSKSGRDRSYYEHDDRGSGPSYDWGDGNQGDRRRGRGGRGQGGDRRRRRGGSSRGQGWDRWQRGSRKGPRCRPSRTSYSGPGPRSRLYDDDTSMAGNDSERPRVRERYNPYERKSQRSSRGNEPGGSKRRSYPNRSFHRNNNNADNRDDAMGDEPLSTWFKVTIPFGAKESQKWLLQSIRNLCTVPFVPHNLHQEQNATVFYVSDSDASNALRDVSKRITTSKGHKIILIVKPSGPPKGVSGIGQPLSDEDKQVLLEVMSKRYDPSSKLLNLSDLYNDSDLLAKNLKIALNKSSSMHAVIDIIDQNIPEMIGLDLSNNRLYSLYSCKQLREKAPNIQSLNLSKNSLKHIDELKVMKGLPLQELILDQNPLCDLFSNQQQYVSAVREIFAEVVKLDGHDLPPPIGFDLKTSTALPQVGPSFFPGEEVKANILQFVERYYAEYDSPDRSKLINVYHEQAKFSLSVPFTTGGAGSWYRQLGHHFSHSRNMKKNLDQNQKNKTVKLLKQGQLAVAAFVNELPSTQHDLNSFVIDVSLVLPGLVHFTVNGVLREQERTKTVIAFSRTFTVCPGPNGLSVLNDQLSLRQPSEKQKKSSFSTPAPTPTHSPVSALPTATLSPAGPSALVVDAVTQQQMVQQFIKDSGMNAAYSQRCLEENSWDYGKAGEVFMALKVSFLQKFYFIAALVLPKYLQLTFIKPPPPC